MSRYELLSTGTLTRASFYLPFYGVRVDSCEVDRNYLSQFDYFPVISSVKINNLNTALLFQKLDCSLPAIYFESHSGNNSYSIIAIQTNPICTSFENLDDLRQFLHSTRVPFLDLPFFTGGLIGFWSYDFGLKLFDLSPKNSTTLPPQYFFMPQEVVVYDKKTQVLTTIIWVDCSHIDEFTFAKAYQRIDDIETLALNIENQDCTLNADNPVSEGQDFTVNIPDAEFCAMIKKAQEYISKGEIYQIVLSRSWKKASLADPFEVFLELRRINPSPYMFFVKLPELILIGASPETQVLVQNRNISVSPIAGTRKICGNQSIDLKAAQDLLTNEKELAEHIMLVDLSRNELSRVSKPGTVKVEELFRLRYFSHVVHLVSIVKGSLSEEHDALEAFKACFPAGTLSGAPKYRAMEIINELEPNPRGIYGGALGYIDFNGNLDSCIIIRTALYKDGEYVIQSGAGIVADSDPKKECLETYYKAKALMTTIQAVEGRYHDSDYRQ